MDHKKAIKKRKKAPESALSIGNILRQSAIGAGIALLCGTVLTLIGSAICYNMSDPNLYTAPMGAGIMFIVSLLGGILTVRRTHGSVLLSGLCAGAIPAILFCFVRLFLSGESFFSSFWSILLRLICVGISILGAFLGNQQKKSGRSAAHHGHRRK